MRQAAECDVLIVGGGVAGLTAAVALADRGLGVTVLEGDGRLGGRAASWQEHGDAVDIGPHVLLSEYRNFPKLLARLGTADHICWQPGKVLTLGLPTGPYALRHRALPTPLSLLPDLLRAPGLSVRDVVSSSKPSWRALRMDAKALRELDAVDGETALRCMGVTDPLLDWFWRFAAMAVMNTPLERCSAAALLRVHAMIMGHRGVHFGFPATALGDLFVPGAVREVTAHGGEVRTNARVESIRPEGGAHVATLAGGRQVTARHCVMAIPPSEVQALMPGLVESDAFQPCPYVSAYLWFDRRVGSEKFWGLPWTPARCFYDFYDLCAIRPSLRERAGSLIACNFIHAHAARDMSDGELVEVALRELAEFAPAAKAARLQHATLHRIPMAISCPHPGVEPRRPANRTGVEGLWLAGDWTDTGLPSSMESAACSGYRVAGEIVGEPMALPMRRFDGLAAWLEKRD